ncbi:STAS domain-containing protein [Streptomyces virginiae]
MTGGSQADGVRVAACSGEFDRDTVPVPADVCERETGAAALLVLDVARVTFAGSSFLNLMIRLHRTRPPGTRGTTAPPALRRLEPSGALGLFEVRDGPNG